MYSEIVMQNVRQSLGLEDPDDKAKDDEIFKLSRLEVLEKCLNWEGVVGFSATIIGFVEDIYGITLEPYLDSGN